MITKFDKYILEFNKYSGEYGTMGFVYSDPVDDYDFSFFVQDIKNTKQIIKKALKKYNILSDNNITSKVDEDGDFEISFSFKSYSDIEATSITKSILDDLYDSGIEFYTNSLKLKPRKGKVTKRPIGFGR